MEKKRHPYFKIKGTERKKIPVINIIFITFMIILILGISTLVILHNQYQSTSNVSGKSELEVLSAVLLDNQTLQVVVQRNSGKGDLVAVTFGINDGDNFVQIKLNSSINKNGNQTFLINLTKLNLKTSRIRAYIMI